jgi:O-glycosyl hydrolase
MKKLLVAGLLAASVFCCLNTRAETEWGSTGDLREFRFKGEPIGITTSIRMSSPDGAQTGQAQLQTPGRADGRLEFTGNVGFGTAAATGAGGRRGGGGGGGAPGASLRVQVDDVATGTTTFDVSASASTNMPLDGIYYWFNFAGANFAAGNAELVPADGAPTTVSFASQPTGGTRYADATVKSIRITGAGNRVVEFSFANPTHIVLQQSPGGGRGGRGGGGAPGGSNNNYSLVIPVGTGTLNPESPFHVAFTLKASCDVDTTPVKLTVDPSRTGPAFIGIGGDFRLQSPADAAVIAYNLANLRVAFARLEMPLSSWQTTETNDPAAGPVADNVRKAMEMGQTLAQKNIPMIISDWSVPSWAATAGGGRGQIAPDKWPAMYKGITSYIAYMKKNYGAEPRLFSFNEADMGINVKLTPEDQDMVIKGLGASFAAAGLATKMLLGDTGNPTPRPANYIEPTIADPEAMKYVGAVSYHSWTGGSDAIIANWGKVAQRFKLPLYIAEGGTDPDSYRHRFLFLEPWYALDEINLYVRCMALSQPASILHWQLTDDYSILRGGRNGQPLGPTQRFFDLKHLNLTPPEAPSLGITSDRPRITAAAYGDATHGWAIHIVNTGTTRAVTITGLPASLTRLYPTITDGTRNMQALAPVPVNNGTAQFNLDYQSFVTLTSAKQ